MKKIILTLVALTTIQSYCNNIRDLISAVISSNINKVEQIINQDKEGKLINGIDSNKMTPLHWAINIGNRDIINLLIDKGADINAQDKNGDTPLHVVAYDGNKDIVKEFLNNQNTDVSQKNKYGYTPSDLARQRKHTEIEKMLQEAQNKQKSLQRMKSQQSKMLEIQKKSPIGSTITIITHK